MVVLLLSWTFKISEWQGDIQPAYGIVCKAFNECGNRWVRVFNGNKLTSCILGWKKILFGPTRAPYIYVTHLRLWYTTRVCNYMQVLRKRCDSLESASWKHLLCALLAAQSGTFFSLPSKTRLDTQVCLINCRTCLHRTPDCTAGVLQGRMNAFAGTCWTYTCS